MKYRIAIAAAVVLAAGAAWLAWRLLQTPAIETSEIVEAPTGHACPGMVIAVISPPSTTPANTSS
jgi:hypothetical protein